MSIWALLRGRNAELHPGVYIVLPAFLSLGLRRHERYDLICADLPKVLL
jgi:hypothetical protein